MMVDGKQKIAHQLVLFVNQHLFISLHYCYLCVPRLHENHLFTTSFLYHQVDTRLLESQVEAEELNQSQSVGMNIVLGLSFPSYFWLL